MAAGDFSASQFPNYFARLQELNLEGNQQGEMNWPTPTADTLMRAQSLRMDYIGLGADCRGVDAHFHQVGSHMFIHDRTTADTAQGCDLVAGPELQTNSVELKNNLFIKAGFTIDAKRCNNASTFNDEMAKGLAKAMATLRRRLNRRYIVMLDGAAQANQATGYGDFSAASAGGNRVAFETGTDNIKTLRKIVTMMDENYFGTQPILISGKSFYHDADIARFYAADDDKRSEAAVFDDARVVFDKRNVDQITGRSTLLAVEPAVLAFWNTAWYPETPEVRSFSDNYTVYKLTDPVAMWNDSGTLRPIEYQVESKYVCSTRLANDELQYTYTINLTLVGGLHKAPDGYNWPLDDVTAPTEALTGVMVFVQEDAVV